MKCGVQCAVYCILCSMGYSVLYSVYCALRCMLYSAQNCEQFAIKCTVVQFPVQCKCTHHIAQSIQCTVCTVSSTPQGAAVRCQSRAPAPVATGSRQAALFTWMTSGKHVAEVTSVYGTSLQGRKMTSQKMFICYLNYCSN